MRFHGLMGFDDFDWAVHVAGWCLGVCFLDVAFVCDSMYDFGGLTVHFHGLMVCNDWAMHVVGWCTVASSFSRVICSMMYHYLCAYTYTCAPAALHMLGKYPSDAAPHIYNMMYDTCSYLCVCLARADAVGVHAVGVHAVHTRMMCTRA